MPTRRRPMPRAACTRREMLATRTAATLFVMALAAGIGGARAVTRAAGGLAARRPRVESRLTGRRDRPVGVEDVCRRGHAHADSACAERGRASVTGPCVHDAATRPPACPARATASDQLPRRDAQHGAHVDGRDRWVRASVRPDDSRWRAARERVRVPHEQGTHVLRLQRVGAHGRGRGRHARGHRLRAAPRSDPHGGQRAGSDACGRSWSGG